MQDWTSVVDTGPPERQFLRPVWFHAWEMAYGDERSWRRPVQYCLLASGPTSQCVLPMATQRIGPFRFASVCGLFFPFRGTPYCGNPEELAALAAGALGDGGSLTGVRHGPTPNADPFLTAMLAAYRRAGWRVLSREIGSEFILENPGSADHFMAGLTSKRRQKIEYYWRRLKKAGPTELRHYQGCEQRDWLQILRDIRTVEAASWVAKSGKPLFLGVRNELFWDTVCSDPWFCKSLHAWVIYHAGTPVSFAWALDAGEVRYLYANGFDARVADYRTGTKIYQQLIYDAFSRGIKRINFGLGDSGYKSLWGARPNSSLIEAVAFSPRLLGSFAYLAAQTKELAARWRRQRISSNSDTAEDNGQPVSSLAEATKHSFAHVEVSSAESN